MFSNLNAEMARNKLTIKALAEKTGINYEMVSIKKEFPTCTLDYLFSTD